MADWTPEAFTKEDITLRLAYNRIKRFEIKKVKDLTHGVYVNVRETLSLDNVLIETYKLNGKPNKNNSINTFCFDSTYCLSGYYTDKPYKETMFVGTLIGYNRGFRYNTKVVQFMKRLKTAGRFEQHCILNDLPYTKKVYDMFCSQVQYRHERDSELFQGLDYGDDDTYAGMTDCWED